MASDLYIYPTTWKYLDLILLSYISINWCCGHSHRIWIMRETWMTLAKSNRVSFPLQEMAEARNWGYSVLFVDAGEESVSSIFEIHVFFWNCKLVFHQYYCLSLIVLRILRKKNQRFESLVDSNHSCFNDCSSSHRFHYTSIYWRISTKINKSR